MLELIKDIVRKKLLLIQKRLSDRLSAKKHVHNWESIDSDTVYPFGVTPETGLPIGKKYILQCTEPSCRKIKIEKDF